MAGLQIIAMVSQAQLPANHGFLGLDWGTVPAWVATGGVFLGIWSYWQGLKIKRREQASLITVWSSRSVPPPGPGVQLESKYKDVTVTAKNASAVAVHSMVVKVHWNTKRAPEGSPKMRWVGSNDTWSVGDLGPGESVTTTFSGVISVSVNSVSFTDSTNRKWKQEAGKLSDQTAAAWRARIAAKGNPIALVRRLWQRSVLWRINRAALRQDNSLEIPGTTNDGVQERDESAARRRDG